MDLGMARNALSLPTPSRVSGSIALKDMSFRPCVNPSLRVSEASEGGFANANRQNRPKSGVKAELTDD
jgi:hypothetical protein